jgi:hypothetical protein
MVRKQFTTVQGNRIRIDIYYLAHARLWHTTRSMKQFKLLLHTLLTQVQTTAAGEIGPRQR